MKIVAQNLQVFYDFSSDRNYVTTTLEMSKPDKWGNSFFFVDYYYDFGSEKHPSGTCMHIARSLKLWEAPVCIRAEYNGGFGSFPSDMGQIAYPINNAWLLGGEYIYQNANLTKKLNLMAFYKHIVGKQESVQFSAVWGLHFFNRKLSMTGVASFWLEDTSYDANTKTSTIFVSQPQFWYNCTEHFSLGSEIELANNFAKRQGFMVRPRLGAKWNF